MKKIILFLLIQHISIFSTLGQNQVYLDSLNIAELHKRLNYFSQTKDPKSLQLQFILVERLDDGNKVIDSIDWKVKLDRKLSCYLEILDTIISNRNLSFFDTLNSPSQEEVESPPCRPVYDTLGQDITGIYNIPPDRIANDSCRLAYIRIRQKFEILKEKGIREGELIHAQSNTIDSIKKVFENSEFLNEDNLAVYINPLIEQKLNTDIKKQIVRIELGLE